MGSISQFLRTALCCLWILPRTKKVSTGPFFTLAMLGPSSSNPITTEIQIKKRVAEATLFFMGWVMGFEPTNTGTTIRGLRPLGDTHHMKFAEKWHARRVSIEEERLGQAFAGNAHPRCIQFSSPSKAML